MSDEWPAKCIELHIHAHVDPQMSISDVEDVLRSYLAFGEEASQPRPVNVTDAHIITVTTKEK